MRAGSVLHPSVDVFEIYFPNVLSMSPKRRQNSLAIFHLTVTYQTVSEAKLCVVLPPSCVTDMKMTVLVRPTAALKRATNAAKGQLLQSAESIEMKVHTFNLTERTV